MPQKDEQRQTFLDRMRDWANGLPEALLSESEWRNNFRVMVEACEAERAQVAPPKRLTHYEWANATPSLGERLPADATLTISRLRPQGPVLYRLTFEYRDQMYQEQWAVSMSQTDAALPVSIEHAELVTHLEQLKARGIL